MIYLLHLQRFLTVPIFTSKKIIIRAVHRSSKIFRIFFNFISENRSSVNSANSVSDDSAASSINTVSDDSAANSVSDDSAASSINTVSDDSAANSVGAASSVSDDSAANSITPSTPVSDGQDDYFVLDKSQLGPFIEEEERAKSASEKCHFGYAIKKSPQNKIWENELNLNLSALKDKMILARENTLMSLNQDEILIPSENGRYSRWAPISSKSKLVRMDALANYEINEAEQEVTINVFAQGTDKKLLQHLLIDLENDGVACQTYPVYEKKFLLWLLEQMQVASKQLASKGKDVNKINISFSGHSLGAALSQHFLASLIKVLHGKHCVNSKYENIATGQGFQGANELFQKVRGIEVNLANSPGLSSAIVQEAESLFKELKEKVTVLNLKMTILQFAHDPVQRFAGQKLLGASFKANIADILMAKVYCRPIDCMKDIFRSTVATFRALFIHSFKIHKDSPFKIEYFNNRTAHARIIDSLRKKFSAPSLLPHNMIKSLLFANQSTSNNDKGSLRASPSVA